MTKFAVLSNDNLVTEQLIYDALYNNVKQDDIVLVGVGKFNESVKSMAIALGLNIQEDRYFFNNSDKNIVLYGELNKYEIFEAALQ